MAIDVAGGRLFVASEENATLQVVDLRTFAVLEHHEVGDEPDVLAFDSTLRRLYVASESGAVSVFDESDGKLASEGQITLAHAHTISVDSRSHLVYLPLQNIEGHPLLRIAARPARPTAAPR